MTVRYQDLEASATATWLTCSEAAQLLGVGESTIRYWARVDKLKPERARRTHPSGSSREVDVFDPAQLAVFAARRKITRVPSGPGEIAATAFELFDQGASMRRVVTEVRETPQRVAELHEQWLDFGGADLVVGPQAREALVRLVGEFGDVADLVRAVADAVERRVEVVVDSGSALERASDAQVEQAILAVVSDAAGSVEGPAGAPDPG